ncbi:hypothetical protein P775_18750 [Puniceibacterium antarcticum]|uniref:Cytochrome c domain-containing protein n=2 Tax=Puniceibacterium antarcticum TaxID=1206336 RepID=A0A2G8RAP9_9RHOB|nr:hypothetical protein P775_18750 [Puniceibacterium antarcticum]
MTLAAGAAYANPVAPGDVSFSDTGAIAESLTGTPGDAASGAKVLADRGAGNCVACHKISSLDAAFQGTVGPSLDGVGDRWDSAQLRGLVANAKHTFPGTIMPSFYKTAGYIRPGDEFSGKAAKGDLQPLLSAEQVEDVVAFLTTLKQQ